MAKTVGMRIAELRAEKEMTQTELGQQISVSRDVIAKWEGDQREISASNIDRLAEFFGVSCDYLIRGVSEKHRTVVGELGLTDESVNALKTCVHTKAHEALQLINEMVAKWSDFTRLAILVNQYVHCAIRMIDEDLESREWDTLPKNYDSLSQNEQWLEDWRCKQTTIAEFSDLYEHRVHTTVIEIIDDVMSKRVLPASRRRYLKEMEEE